jgi:hypothetical protein
MKTSALFLVVFFIFLFSSCQKEPLLTPNEITVQSQNSSTEERFNQQKPNNDFNSLYNPNSVEPTNNNIKDAAEIPIGLTYQNSFLTEDDHDWWKVRALGASGTLFQLNLDVRTVGYSPIKVDVYTPAGAHIEKYIVPSSLPNVNVQISNLVNNTFIYVKITQLGTGQEEHKNYGLRFY